MSLCECGCGQPAPLSTRHRAERGQHKGAPVRFIRGHAMRGKTLSAESRQKMSAVRRGKRHTEATRALMTANTPSGEAHPDWKGDDVSYSTIHGWLGRVATKSGVCSVCQAARLTQWANLSGVYKRDVDDFVEMCVPCHKRFDASRKAA